ncbi:unannotated protein [freshwater metagenome]|uniref:Unannotated protein n=1 Tax=freshwater metagenome TaxID=449393 RepID=A0A6J7JYF4_9ZZZZ|nr:DUF1905 domain-containing protein [Actinomycetota bacterium]
MEFQFQARIFEWRGPAPFYFVALPDDVATFVASMANQLTYGWGVIPVSATIGKTTFTTSMFPREGGYLLGLKATVRSTENLKQGDDIEVKLALNM